MKLLMIYMNRFFYKPSIKTIESMTDFIDGKVYINIQTEFIQVEKEDKDNDTAVKNKL